MFIVLLISIFIAIFLEATVVSLPLAFILLLCYSILNRSGKVFISSFVIGLILDIASVRTLGSTSIYFLLFFAFVLLYQRKYEIRSYPFVIASSFVGSYAYLLLLSESASVLQAVISSAFSTAIFAIGKRLRKKED